MLFGVMLCMLCSSCLHPLCCYSPSDDVYRVPDAFPQRFKATAAWEHSLSSIACCNATLKIHFLSNGGFGGPRSLSIWPAVVQKGSVLLSRQPKDQ